MTGRIVCFGEILLRLAAPPGRMLLQTPAHAAGEIQRLMKAVREDKMPRDETDIEQPLDDQLKSALLESGAAFEAVVQNAKDWEARHRIARRSRQ